MFLLACIRSKIYLVGNIVDLDRCCSTSLNDARVGLDDKAQGLSGANLEGDIFGGRVVRNIEFTDALLVQKVDATFGVESDEIAHISRSCCCSHLF